MLHGYLMLSSDAIPTEHQQTTLPTAYSSYLLNRTPHQMIAPLIILHHKVFSAAGKDEPCRIHYTVLMTLFTVQGISFVATAAAFGIL